MNLIDRCIKDPDLNPDGLVDDEIYLWHQDMVSKLDLHEHLGMSWNEWNAWVEQKVSLKQIVHLRKAMAL